MGTRVSLWVKTSLLARTAQVMSARCLLLTVRCRHSAMRAKCQEFLSKPAQERRATLDEARGPGLLQCVWLSLAHGNGSFCVAQTLGIIGKTWHLSGFSSGCCQNYFPCSRSYVMTAEPGTKAESVQMREAKVAHFPEIHSQEKTAELGQKPSLSPPGEDSRICLHGCRSPRWHTLQKSIAK